MQKCTVLRKSKQCSFKWHLACPRKNCSSFAHMQAPTCQPQAHAAALTLALDAYAAASAATLKPQKRGELQHQRFHTQISPSHSMPTLLTRESCTCLWPWCVWSCNQDDWMGGERFDQQAVACNGRLSLRRALETRQARVCNIP